MTIMDWLDKNIEMLTFILNLNNIIVSLINSKHWWRASHLRLLSVTINDVLKYSSFIGLYIFWVVHQLYNANRSANSDVLYTLAGSPEIF